MKRSGWCIEHDSSEVFSFGDTPRGFCLRNDEEDTCDIEQLLTRQEFIDSLDIEAAKLAVMDLWLIDDHATAKLISILEPIFAAALGEETT